MNVYAVAFYTIGIAEREKLSLDVKVMAWKFEKTGDFLHIGTSLQLTLQWVLGDSCLVERKA